MAGMMQITGVKKVTAKLKQSKQTTLIRLRTALTNAGLYLQQLSQKEVPVDTGTLRNSAFTRDVTKPGSKVIEILVGYTVGYSLHVHENVDTVHANGNAKFLEGPLRKNHGKLMAMVGKEMKS